MDDPVNDVVDDVLTVERRGAVALLTMNRPEQHNALDAALKEALVHRLREVGDDPAVRAVVLTGAGSSFCVGQDLAELAATLAADPAGVAATVRRHFNPITRSLATMPKPVVAAVGGTCVGAGLGFALACDVQVWAEQATLATAFSGVALTCDSGLSASLARSVGQARAMSLVLLGERFTPEQAGMWGFAGPVLPGNQVLAKALEIAERLAAGPTLAYAASKTLIAQGTGRELEQVLEAEAVEQTSLSTTQDHVAAVSGFLEGRRTTFVAG